MAEVSEAQKVIVAVLASHIEDGLTNYDTGRNECGCCTQRPDETYREHLAAEIDKALGVLAQERRTLHNGWVQPGYGAFYYAQGLTPPPAIITNEVRWVSAWAEVGE